MDLELSALRGQTEPKPEPVKTITMSYSAPLFNSVPTSSRPVLVSAASITNGSGNPTKWKTQEYDRFIGCQHTKSLLEKYKEIIGVAIAKDGQKWYNMMETARADYSIFNPDSEYVNYRLTAEDGTMTKLINLYSSKPYANFAITMLQRILAGIGVREHHINQTYGVTDDDFLSQLYYADIIPEGSTTITFDQLKKACKKSVDYVIKYGYSFDTEVKGQIKTGYNAKWYKFKPDNNGIYRFDLTNIPAGKDYDIFLYDSNFKAIGSSIDRNRNTNSETISNVINLSSSNTY